MRRLLVGLLLCASPALAQTTVTVSGDGAATVVTAGTVGPAGPIGATGPTGPTGPAGMATATLVVAASNSARTTGADYICTGTADQTTINTAIAALPAAGGHVVLLDGLYSITGAIVMKDGAWLQGQGAGTVVKVTTGTNDIDMVAARTAGTNSNLVISDFVLNANSSTGIQGVYVTNGDNVRVERMMIKDGAGTSYGIMSFGATNLLLQDNFISGWGDSVMELKASHRVRVARNSLVNGTFQLYTQVDESGAAPNDYSVVGNTFKDADILMTNAGTILQDFVFANNTWTDTDDRAVNCQALWRYANNVTIVGNTFDSSADTSYTLATVVLEATATNVIFSGNTIRTGTGTAGAYGYDGLTLASPGAIVEGNLFTLPGDYNEGVVATTASTAAVIRGNRFVVNSGSHTGCVTLSATADVTVQDNICDTTGGTGISVAATSSGTRVIDNFFRGTVAASYSLLDVTTLFRDQAGMAYASLPADVADGSLVYCSNCTLASPCAAGGTGAIAKRLNNAWNCQ